MTGFQSKRASARNKLKDTMTKKAPKKPAQTVAEKMYENRAQIYYAVNSLNDLLPMLAIAKVYIDSESFNKYTLKGYLDGIQTILIHGTCEIESWLEIQHGDKNV